MKLYSYWRSSCSYRVRIGLNLKGLDYQIEPVHLVEGRQHSEDYRRRNPIAQVPTLVLDDGTNLVQSMAILEYLEDAHGGAPLLPEAPAVRARVRALAELVNSGIQPLQNFYVLKHVERELGGSKLDWSRHFIRRGLLALEEMAAGEDSAFLVGDQPTLADIFMVPQLYNARRFELDMGELPRLVAVDAACQEHEAFVRAHPDNQPDAPEGGQ
ncbi:MAG: maleylacetoacetate isomerase [Deltaproteobacteria bacterium]|nr:maleylacetoacetate isomerase [Deltaproteobacteria bacterium]